MYRSIICFIIIASLIICSTSVAFANPLDPWTSVQADRVTNGVVSIDSTLSNLYTGFSALYNYLKNNGDGVVEGLLVLANRVSNIINTLDYYLPLQNSVLQNLYSFFVPPSGDTRDIWDLLSQISANTTATSTALNTTNSELLSIDSHIDGVESSLTSIGSRLDTANVNLQSLESINWLSDSRFTLSYSTDNVTYYDNISELSSNSRTIYIKITGFTSTFNLFYLDFNNINLSDSYFNDPNEFKFEFYTNDSLLNDPEYLFDYSYRYGKLLFYPYSTFNNRTNIIKMTSLHNIRIFTSSNNLTLKYLPFESNDYFTVAKYIELNKLSNNINNLSDIKNILIDIDNNSDFIQNNNDLQINVDIDPSVGTGVTSVISKIQDLLDFGISLQEFLVVLNQFDNIQWFTRLETYEQVNQDPRFSPGYIDLYD